SRLAEAVTPVPSSEAGKRSFGLRNCRGQLGNVPMYISSNKGPLKIPFGKRNFCSFSARLNANQLLDSFTCRSLLLPACFAAVY
ncbi:MAG: hypothetical protein Q4F29_09780, partial [Lachnospiraceae bacterium]|nr:hypothetical protein [Lachnospiraceae bacterium]